MSNTLESGTQSVAQATPKTIDYAALYQAIGDIVIERAHTGDQNCEQIYEVAWKKTVKGVAT